MGESRWIYSSYDEIQCLNCGFTYKDEISFLISSNYENEVSQMGFKYCPNCGTKMNGIKPDGHWMKE